MSFFSHICPFTSFMTDIGQSWSGNLHLLKNSQLHFGSGSKWSKILTFVRIPLIFNDKTQLDGTRETYCMKGFWWTRGSDVNEAQSCFLWKRKQEWRCEKDTTMSTLNEVKLLVASCGVPEPAWRSNSWFPVCSCAPVRWEGFDGLKQVCFPTAPTRCSKSTVHRAKK